MNVPKQLLLDSSWYSRLILMGKSDGSTSSASPSFSNQCPSSSNSPTFSLKTPTAPESRVDTIKSFPMIVCHAQNSWYPAYKAFFFKIRQLSFKIWRNISKLPRVSIFKLFLEKPIKLFWSPHDKSRLQARVSLFIPCKIWALWKRWCRNR